ncbi:MAG: glycosyltransferase family 2 protein [Syntrophobacteraceae bacterium]|nr:glycosyltransferase family 2 protein [Syntrophobacteraceae bacterium]
MRVSVVIPACNEQDAIAAVVKGLPPGLVQEVIVVDNGSTDATAQRAEKAGARVVKESRRGYGAACHKGLMAVQKADVVVFLDGDNSDDPAELPFLLAPIESGRADLVIGSRLSGAMEPEAMPSHARLGNRLVARFLCSAYKVKISDIGSFRAVRKSVLLSLGMEQMTFGWPVEMLVKAARRGAGIVEVPVSYRKRIGISKVSGTVRGTILTAYYMLWIPLRYAFRD